MRGLRIILPLAAALALTATACARVPVRTGSAGGVGLATSRGVTTIKLLLLGNEPWVDAAISAFHAQNTGYRVEYVPLSAGADKQQVIQTMADTNAIDVVPLLDVEAMVAAGQLLDLEPFINKAHFDLNALAVSADQLRRVVADRGLPPLFAMSTPPLTEQFFNRNLPYYEGIITVNIEIKITHKTKLNKRSVAFLRVSSGGWLIHHEDFLCISKSRLCQRLHLPPGFLGRSGFGCDLDVHELLPVDYSLPAGRFCVWDGS